MVTPSGVILYVIIRKVMRDYDLPEVEKWLDSFQNFERSFNSKMIKLETTKVLVEYFGHPEKVCPCFHVAGSKGKGTIAMSVVSILTGAGKKVGVFMSPHVLHFTERVRFGDGAFGREIYMRAFEILKSGIRELLERGILTRGELTWFELVTLFAMLVFREAQVDFAVYEVGMGGRLDATNIVSPVAIGMGLIELEHTEVLGDTIEEIAGEKAGVFKRNVPIFSVPQIFAVRRVFAEKATEVGAKINYVEDEKFNYIEQDKKVAKMMVKSVAPEIKVDELCGRVELLGRYEKITKGVSVPYVLMDGAHTIMSVKVVLERMKNDGVSGVLLFAAAKEPGLLQLFPKRLDLQDAPGVVQIGEH